MNTEFDGYLTCDLTSSSPNSDMFDLQTEILTRSEKN